MQARYKICVCKTKSCSERFSRDVKFELERFVASRGLKDVICIADGGCYGRCTKGPNVLIIGPIPEERWAEFCEQSIMPGPDGPPAQMYNGVSPTDCRELLESHCLHNTPIVRLAEKEKGVKS